MELRVELGDRSIERLAAAELLTGDHAKASNSFESPDQIRSHEWKEIQIASGRARLELPPLSLVAMTLELGKDETVRASGVRE